MVNNRIKIQATKPKLKDIQMRFTAYQLQD